MKRQVMKPLLATVAIAITVLSPLQSSAKTPDEILKPYRSYMSALKAGNKDRAEDYARKTYKAAKTHLKDDDPLIATLAHNWADQTDDTDQKIDLYRQAIELTPAASDDDLVTLAQRWVALGQAHALRPSSSVKQIKAAFVDISKGWEFMEVSSLQNTTFGGEMMVLKGWVAASDDKENLALEWYNRADTVFSGPDHTYFSLLEYTNKVLRGNTLIMYDRNIEGAIALQDVMQNLEGDLPVDHPYVQQAFHGWLFARGKIEQSGQTKTAEQAGVCKCWPYDEMSENAPIPLLRVPPIMPPSARKLAAVMVRFDVTAEGVPKDIEVLGYTQKLFVKPTVRSVKKWQYDVSDELESEDLKGITTTITFRLTDERGEILPAPPMQMLVEPG